MLDVAETTAKAVKFLFTHIVGTIILAALGGMSVCAGCIGVTAMLLGAPVEREPTTLAIATMESEGAPTYKHWLQFSDGHLFWPLLRVVETKQYSSDKEPTKYRYVPLVSKAVLDAWLQEIKQSGNAAVFEFDRPRVIVKFSPDDFVKLFPGITPAQPEQAKPFALHTVKGYVRKLSEEKSEVHSEVARQTRGFSAERIVVLTYDDEPAGIGTMFLVFLLGLGLLVPLGTQLYVRKKKKAAEASAQVVEDLGAPQVYADNGVIFQYPKLWFVTPKPFAGLANAWQLEFDCMDMSLYLFVLPGTMAEMFIRNYLPTVQNLAYAQDVRVSQKSFPPLAGQPARGFEYTARLVGQPISGRVEATTTGTKTLGFFWQCQDENLPANKPALEMIRSSLRLLEIPADVAPAPAPPRLPQRPPEPPPAPEPPPVPEPASRQYFVARQGQKLGPYSSKQLKEMAAKGELLRTDSVWTNGMPNWIAAVKIKGLFSD